MIATLASAICGVLGGNPAPEVRRAGVTPSQSRTMIGTPPGAVTPIDAPWELPIVQYGWATSEGIGCPSVGSADSEQGQIAASSLAAPGCTTCIAVQTSSTVMFQKAEKFAANSAGSRRPGACR